MNVVTGLFTAEETAAVVNYLTENGFPPDRLSVISSPMELPAYLEGEPEQAAAAGAVLGAVAGGTIGALTTLAASAAPGFRALPIIVGAEPLLVFGLMTTAVGSAVGGYLGSLYSVRADSEPQIDVVKLLESGHIILVVTTEGEGKAETAVSLMQQLGGQQIEIHPLPTENDEKGKAVTDHHV
ncbi:MAG: hypothetical protein KJ069_07040 [Anaerolineae bacterium]|nr:hypothetical protein [Anaerolineae bacterium]